MGFGTNAENDNNLVLLVSTLEEEPVDYEVFSPYGYYTNGTISPFSFTSISLDRRLTVYGATDRNKGIWVRATDPGKHIFVSGMNYKERTADAFLALPPGPVKDTYTYITSSMLWTNRTAGISSSLILIVGQHNDTVVTITPTQYVTIPDDLLDPNIQDFVRAGQSYTIRLDQLETYQISSNLDLTGSQIVSNNPLSVFSGHQCADVPPGLVDCDHLFEQVPQTSTLGSGSFFLSHLTLSHESPQNGTE